MVPHLVTALTGPINELEQRVLDSMPAIERWFRLEWMEHAGDRWWPIFGAVYFVVAVKRVRGMTLLSPGWKNSRAMAAAPARAYALQCQTRLLLRTGRSAGSACWGMPVLSLS